MGKRQDMSIKSRYHKSVGKNPNKKIYREYTILFCIMSLIIFLPFLLKKNSFVQMADGYNQCLPVLAYAGEYGRDFISSIVHGEEIAQFDFSIGYGMTLSEP